MLRRYRNSPVIESLRGLYGFNDYRGVSQYLGEHPGLATPLMECYLKVREYFGPDQRLTLELLADPEGQQKKLFVLIPTKLPVTEARACLQRLDQEWWLKAPDAVHTKLNIDVEYV